MFRKIKKCIINLVSSSEDVIYLKSEVSLLKREVEDLTFRIKYMEDGYPTFYLIRTSKGSSSYGCGGGSYDCHDDAYVSREAVAEKHETHSYNEWNRKTWDLIWCQEVTPCGFRNGKYIFRNGNGFIKYECE